MIIKVHIPSFSEIKECRGLFLKDGINPKVYLLLKNPQFLSYHYENITAGALYQNNVDSKRNKGKKLF